jgi:hypothetical protein
VGFSQTFKRQHAATSRDIEEKLKQIKQVIKSLKEFIDQYASKGSGDTAALRAQFKKATYLFRKDGLRDMSSDLDTLGRRSQPSRTWNKFNSCPSSYLLNFCLY